MLFGKEEKELGWSTIFFIDVHHVLFATADKTDGSDVI